MIRSPKTIQECRKAYCELCGSPAQGDPDHIRARSLGGADIRENQIQLCGKCHRAKHDGRLSIGLLVAIVARREGLTTEEVCVRIGLALSDAPFEPPQYYRDLVPLSLEEIYQRVATEMEDQDDSRWEMGRLLAYLLRVRRLKSASIASALGCSSAQVREIAKTFEAFPEEHLRAKDLSWYHHRLAAKTDAPADWIDKAVTNGWSTRELGDAIKREKAADAKTGVEGAVRLPPSDLPRVKSLLDSVVRVKESGGEAWTWLKEKLLEMLAEEKAQRAA
ncbi:MAG: HNH endonuclease [Firmicutes bacterium]|nr:HNH endonuclease [Bacillota bacterium]